LSGLHQQAAQITVASLGDAPRRVRFSRLALPRTQAQKGACRAVAGRIRRVQREHVGCGYHRSRDGLKYFLKDYRQVLLADAYGGYNGVVAGNEITRAGCWAHVRRKVIEAGKAAPEIAREAIELVRALYAIERQARDASVAERLKLQQERSAPVLADLRQRLLMWKEQLLPKHPMAEAISYALGQWTELNVFCSDGAVAIDNNVSEREMKRAVLNRKNSLLVGNPRGGRTAAILTSLTSTCRRHDVDAQFHLTQLLTNLSQVRKSELANWLPDKWKQLQAARIS
jgi:transposase